jgi:hypothetical protein
VTRTVERKPKAHEWPLRVVDCPSCGWRHDPKARAEWWAGGGVENAFYVLGLRAQARLVRGRIMEGLARWRPPRPTKDRVSMFRSLQGLGAHRPRTEVRPSAARRTGPWAPSFSHVWAHDDPPSELQDRLRAWGAPPGFPNPGYGHRRKDRAPPSPHPQHPRWTAEQTRHGRGWRFTPLAISHPSAKHTIAAGCELAQLSG